MLSFKRKIKELIYSFSTEDRYAEYNPSESIKRPGGSALAGSSSFNAVNESQIQLNELTETNEFGSNDGISETLLAWRHIDNWCSDHNPDLFATLSDPCTRNDINNAERDLSITFPASVRASLRIHDGQEDLESMTGTSGLIYGLQLMSLDSIVQMTQTWRNVAFNMKKNTQRQLQKKALKSPSTSGKIGPDNSDVSLESQSSSKQKKGYDKLETNDYKSMNPHLRKNISQNYNHKFKLNYIPRQGSIPPLAIQPVYAHPGWIPLVTDNAGNHIGIDLAPGPKGKYSQVILFGRDFDTKFVIANTWGDFLLCFANDLEVGNWYLVDDHDDYFSGDGELVFRDKQSNGPITDYMEVLKKRAWKRWKDTQSTKEFPSSSTGNAPIQNSDSLYSNSKSSDPIVVEDDSNSKTESDKDSSTPNQKPNCIKNEDLPKQTPCDKINNSTDDENNTKQYDNLETKSAEIENEIPLLDDNKQDSKNLREEFENIAL